MCVSVYVCVCVFICMYIILIIYIIDNIRKIQFTLLFGRGSIFSREKLTEYRCLILNVNNPSVRRTPYDARTHVRSSR